MNTLGLHPVVVRDGTRVKTWPIEVSTARSWSTSSQRRRVPTEDTRGDPMVAEAFDASFAAMALALIALPINVWVVGGIFIAGGIHFTMEETREDSFSATRERGKHHGMAFETPATVNGLGDFASSIIVGLWTAFGTTVAFGYSAVLFLAGAMLLLAGLNPLLGLPDEFSRLTHANPIVALRSGNR